MRRSGWVWFGSVLLTAATAGCGGISVRTEDGGAAGDADDPGSGGKAGKSGEGASTGMGGSAGKGGKAGKGGGAGKTGASGNGGRFGQGGTSVGQGGTSVGQGGTSVGQGGTSVGGGGGGGNAGNGGEAGEGDRVRPPAAEDWTRDILSTDLELDVATLRGVATIVLAGSASSQAASFEIGDLAIESVEDSEGRLNYAIGELALPEGQRLDVGVPSTSSDPTIRVSYRFSAHDGSFAGWMPAQGASFLWPYYCGNLFPCKSATADGVAFTMHVTGAPPDKTLIYPTEIPGTAPSYQPALAIGDYTKIDLGQTSNGTTVSTWYLNDIQDGESDARAGTKHLREVFEFYETTYGATPFGNEVGSVAANWGPGDFGGMEHHPFWHVAYDSMYREEIHAHEAAHYLFGDGVRMRCWEDFVLSEGTATYLSARALGVLGVDLWPSLACRLQRICNALTEDGENIVVLPATCNEIDILTSGLWSDAPYVKGAYFYANVARVLGDGETGAAALDETLAAFYQAHVGRAASMRELVDFIAARTDAPRAAAVEELKVSWLETLACPVDLSTLCL